ncbi:MAG TPA: DUF4397 domain-containing protein [Gemmatimonadales bacterium]|nr:DUF4397 domain-containing protein [Gemmatimonadales bacterium]
MRTLRYWLAAAACFAVACDDSTSPDENDAELRLLHATSDLGALDVEVGGTTVISGVAFGHTSEIVMVPSGIQQIIVRSNGTIVGQIEGQLTTAHLNALTVAAGIPQLSATVIPDTGQVATDRANLRLVNVAGSNTDEPFMLHVLISAPGLAPDSIVRIGLDTRVGSYSSLIYFDPGEFLLRYAPENTETVLTQATFDIAAGETKVAILQRDAAGNYTVQVVIEDQ